MKRIVSLFVIVLMLFLAPGVILSGQDDKSPVSQAGGAVEENPHPDEAVTEAADANKEPASEAKEYSPADIRKAMDEGLAFLRKTQSKEGTWGSHDPVVVDNAQLGFGMLNKGCHDGMRIACTALCAKALLQYPDRSAEDDAALDKAITCLLKNWKLAYDPGNAFNCWGYCFNLDFLTTLNAHPLGKKWEKEIKEVVPKVMGGLRKMQAVEGGWAYYTSVMMEGDSISFITASIVLGLIHARDQGFEVPEGMIEDGANILKTMVLPNKNIIYGTYLKYNTGHLLEDLSMGGRNQVGGLVLYLFDKTYTWEDLIDRSAHYFNTVDYVETTGNKRIIPHTDAPQNISGYFLYYGLYYAAETLVFLGKDAQAKHWKHLVKMIMDNHEKEGCWWDTLCYDYGDKWGTAFALLCLEYYMTTHDLWESEPVKKRIPV